MVHCGGCPFCVKEQRNRITYFVPPPTPRRWLHNMDRHACAGSQWDGVEVWTALKSAVDGALLISVRSPLLADWHTFSQTRRVLF